MRKWLRLAWFVAPALSLGLPGVAAACTPVPEPSPPPRTAEESEADFEVRRRKWYSDLAERHRQEVLPRWVAAEDRLWATAHRVVLARVEKVRSIRLRGSERQWYESPLVTLRTLRWLKGRAVAKRLQVHYLSDDSCQFGGAGAVPEGEVGEVFLLFYRSGPLGPRNILDSLSRDGIRTARSREAFDLPDAR